MVMLKWASSRASLRLSASICSLDDLCEAFVLYFDYRWAGEVPTTD
jgi:hypothetical protein